MIRFPIFIPEYDCDTDLRIPKLRIPMGRINFINYTQSLSCNAFFSYRLRFITVRNVALFVVGGGDLNLPYPHVFSFLVDVRFPHRHYLLVLQRKIYRLRS